MWGKMWKDVVNVNCQISNKSVSKIGEVVDLQGRGEGGTLWRDVVNVIWGSKPPIEASTTPQNVTDTAFDTKFKNMFSKIFST